jgi:glycosyltransferase involved in cell wall biosynthesis
VDLSLAAVASLRQRDPDLELVLVGAPRAPVPALEQPRPWVRIPGWVEDADLPALFAGAAAVLAPSRGEGFDLPLLEALACGAAAVASDIAVHREHFAPAVEFFASGDAEALAEATNTVLADSGRAAALRKVGPALAAGFDWTEVARRHLELWREVGRR